MLGIAKIIPEREGDYHTKYTIRECKAQGGSVAEWSKALVLGTSHSVAWVRIPPLPVAFYLSAISC